MNIQDKSPTPGAPQTKSLTETCNEGTKQTKSLSNREKENVSRCQKQEKRNIVTNTHILVNQIKNTPKHKAQPGIPYISDSQIDSRIQKILENYHDTK